MLIVITEGLRADPLHRLVDDGQLPTFRRLLEAGIGGELSGGASNRAAVWASIATGTPPDRHGIVTDFVVRPDRAGIEPFGASCWQVPPFWDTLSRSGIDAAIVGLPGTSPASDWIGPTVDDRFAASPRDGDEEWPMPPRCIQPAALRDVLRPCRVHPLELDPDDDAELPPAVLAEAATIQAAALLLQGNGPEVLIVAHPVAARFPGDAALRLLDMLLAALIGARGGAMEVMVVSPDGPVIAVGVGFAADTLRLGLRPADVAATVLARFGLKAAGGTPFVATNVATLRSISIAPDVPRPSPFPPKAGDPPIVVEVLVAQARATAASLVERGEHEQATQQLQSLLAILPDDPEALLLLGQVQFLRRNWEGCLATGAALDRVAPDAPWGPMLQGVAWAFRGDERGTELLGAAARRSQGNPAALCRLGAIALYLQDVGQARAYYAAALHVEAYNPDALAGLGLTHLSDGDAAEGERLLRQSLRHRYHAPAIHHQLALLTFSQQRWTHAMADIQAAIDQGNDETQLRDLLAKASAALLG